MLLLTGAALLPKPLLAAAADAVDDPGAPDINAVVVIVKGRSGVLLEGDSMLLTLLPWCAGSELIPLVREFGFGASVREEAEG